MKTIKIAHIAHSVGGVDVCLRLILDHINTNIFSSVVIHGCGDTNKPFLDHDKNAIRSYSISIFRDIALIQDFKSILSAYSILKKEKPNLIHAHSAKGGIIGRIVGLLLGIKVIYTPHAFSYLSAQSGFKKKLFLTIEKVLAYSTHLLLATSSSEKKRAVEEVGYKPKDAIVFNNCIEPIINIESLSIPSTWSQDYICTVGRPSYQKNIEQMLRVLHEVNKVTKLHLVVMGVGPVSDQLESVKNLIEELDLSHCVTLLNWTERSDVFAIISQSKFYISTARYEGMPYAIIESLALSKPCIVSDCDGNIDLIKDGYNGFIVPSNDVQRFKDKILELLTDESLRNKLSANANKSFAENYNIQKNIAQLEAIYLKYSKFF